MKIHYILFLTILFISCTSRQDKINKLVKIYNSTELDTKDSYMKGIRAEKITEDEIKITISMTTTPNSTSSKMYTSLFPELMKDMVFSIGLSKQLANDGVKFNCILLADDNSVILSKVFDKDYLRNNGNKGSGLIDSNNDMDLYKFAEIMNRDLPIVDSVNDVTILEIEILNDSEAQFIYLVPEETIDILMSGDEISDYMKYEYLSNPKQKKALKEFFKLGLKKFYLLYSNKERTKNKKIVFTAVDLL